MGLNSPFNQHSRPAEDAKSFVVLFKLRFKGNMATSPAKAGFQQFASLLNHLGPPENIPLCRFVVIPLTSSLSSFRKLNYEKKYSSKMHHFATAVLSGSITYTDLWNRNWIQETFDGAPQHSKAWTCINDEHLMQCLHHQNHTPANQFQACTQLRVRKMCQSLTCACVQVQLWHTTQPSNFTHTHTHIYISFTSWQIQRDHCNNFQQNVLLSGLYYLTNISCQTSTSEIHWKSFTL